MDYLVNFYNRYPSSKTAVGRCTGQRWRDSRPIYGVHHWPDVGRRWHAGVKSWRARVGHPVANSGNTVFNAGVPELADVWPVVYAAAIPTLKVGESMA